MPRKVVMVACMGKLLMILIAMFWCHVLEWNGVERQSLHNL